VVTGRESFCCTSGGVFVIGILDDVIIPKVPLLLIPDDGFAAESLEDDDVQVLFVVVVTAVDDAMFCQGVQ
jgi:hypothetical protein